LAPASFDPLYSPFCAAELALALSSKAAWAALKFSSFPYHTLTAEFCKALPYEKVKVQGLLMSFNWFIAFKFNDASSSDCPPDKKQTPTKAGTAVLLKAAAVLMAIS
jgi:hypothetical protein